MLVLIRGLVAAALESESALAVRSAIVGIKEAVIIENLKSFGTKVVGLYTAKAALEAGKEAGVSLVEGAAPKEAAKNAASSALDSIPLIGISHAATDDRPAETLTRIAEASPIPFAGDAAKLARTALSTQNDVDAPAEAWIINSLLPTLQLTLMKEMVSGLERKGGAIDFFTILNAIPAGDAEAVSDKHIKAAIEAKNHFIDSYLERSSFLKGRNPCTSEVTTPEKEALYALDQKMLEKFSNIVKETFYLVDGIDSQNPESVQERLAELKNARNEMVQAGSSDAEIDHRMMQAVDARESLVRETLLFRSLTELGKAAREDIKQQSDSIIGMLLKLKKDPNALDSFAATIARNPTEAETIRRSIEQLGDSVCKANPSPDTKDFIHFLHEEAARAAASANLADVRHTGGEHPTTSVQTLPKAPASPNIIHH